MKQLFIETYGCQMNVADSEVIASVMKMAGYETCDDLEQADIDNKDEVIATLNAAKTDL